MTPVLIANTNDVKIPQKFCDDNGWYSEHQERTLGITRFGKALIELTINSSKLAQWAIKNTDNNYYVKRVNGSKIVVYEIYIELNDTMLTYWNLKQGVDNVY